jgi:hypothetical protein
MFAHEECYETFKNNVEVIVWGSHYLYILLKNELKWYFKVCYEIMSYFHYILGTFKNILGIFLNIV